MIREAEALHRDHPVGPQSRPTRLHRAEDGTLSPLSAAVIAGGSVALAALVARPFYPDTRHPGIRRWYGDLDKPGFTPPKPAFAIVWPTIEMLLAIGGYRLLRQPSSRERTEALALLAAAVALIPGWSKIFFGERRLATSLAIIVAQLGIAAAGYVAAARRVDSAAAAAGLPLAAWLMFAIGVNEEIWRRNRV